jgi:high-affinity K+ transport system ATPase subunit B
MINHRVIIWLMAHIVVFWPNLAIIIWLMAHIVVFWPNLANALASGSEARPAQAQGHAQDHSQAQGTSQAGSQKEERRASDMTTAAMCSVQFTLVALNPVHKL